MKNIFFKYTVIVAVLLGFTACEDRLDLIPEQSISNDAAFINEQSTFGALIGAYSLFQDGEITGGESQMITDAMADNVNFVGSFPTLQDVSTYDVLSTNGSTQAYWTEAYECILAANAVIANTPNVSDPGFTDAEKNQIVGEALFIRGATYFHLVNLFAQPFNNSNGADLGVVINNEPFVGDFGAQRSRSTVNEVHAQIRSDLEAAIPLLTGEFDASFPLRATPVACQALLARLHLYRGEYAEVLTRTQEVINNGSFTLASDYSFYNTTSSEHIMTLSHSAIDGSEWALWYTSPTEGGRGDAPFSDELLAAFDTTADLRFTTLNVTRQAADAVDRIFTSKFPNGTTNEDNSPFLRYTELLLNRAEALVQSTNSVNAEAITILNDLRTRAGLSTFTAGDFASPQALIDQLLDERRKELCFEGHRRMDLLRNGLPLRQGLADAAFGGNETVFPIPQREVDLNPNLAQNPGF